MSATEDIALFCLLFPGSLDKREKIICLLESCYDYRDLASDTKTWCYFTVSNRPGALNEIVDNQTCADKSAALGGIEIYSRKAALSHQLHHPEFKRYHVTAAKECLYSQPEGMQAWYPRIGFLARDAVAPAGSIVVTGILKLNDGGDAKSSATAIMHSFATWVKATEHGTLTWCALTRPKAPSEILIFERYIDAQALRAHTTSKKFHAIIKNLKHLTSSMLFNEWEELSTSFTGNVVGGVEPNLAVSDMSKL